MENQKFTSANTSINASKIPTAFTKFSAYGNVLDYGCGKYTAHIKEYVNAQLASYYPYDKYNQTDSVNDVAMYVGNKHGYDTIFCCNVLNVIDSNDVVWDILHNIFNMLNNHSKMYIQIYEGDKSGIGKQTKTDCYQRNMRTKAYEVFFGAFQGAPFTVRYHGNIIEVIKH